MPPKIVKPFDMASGKAHHLPDLFAKFVDTHTESKAYIAKNRPHLADNRNIANFSMPFKDGVHPIICDKAEGDTLGLQPQDHHPLRPSPPPD